MAKTATQSAITKVKIKGTIQQLIGWTLVVFFGLAVIAGGSQIKSSFDVSMVIFCTAMVAGGIFLIISGLKKRKLIKAFHDYSTRFATDPTKSIDILASSIGVTTWTATKNIAEMISNGFFTNTYIDTQRNCLVTTNIQQPTSNGSANTSNLGSYITVQCGGCGANNKIASGTVGECEFCGSQILGK